MPALRPQHTVVVFNGGNALCSTDGAMWDIVSTGDLDLWQPRVETITLAGSDGIMLDQVFVEELRNDPRCARQSSTPAPR